MLVYVYLSVTTVIEEAGYVASLLTCVSNHRSSVIASLRLKINHFYIWSFLLMCSSLFICVHVCLFVCVKARISVLLKEKEKMLDLQAKSRQRPVMYSVGVGDDEPIDLDSLSRSGNQRMQNGADFRSDIQVVRKVNLDSLSASKKPSRDIGVGDGNVFAVEMPVTDVGPVRIHEREVSTEQNTEVKEKEIKTVFLSGGTGDTAAVMGGFPQVAAKPKQTRSIGVGDDRVYDTSDTESSSLQVREKELRTVYIDGAEGAATVQRKPTRNVGILCKAAMREVGVMYHYDDAAPVTRNIAVGVGEIGVSDGYELAEHSDTSVHVTNMALQQLNMAAFQSRHLRFSNEQLREVLDLMLKKNLRSVAVQCRFATVDRSVSTAATAAENSASVGCSDDTVDVDVVPVRQFRSIAIDCRPSVFHRACGADFVYRVDSATNTRTQGIRVDRGSNTDTVVKYPAATNTDSRLTGVTLTTETESVVSDGGGEVSTGEIRTTTVSGGGGDISAGQFRTTTVSGRGGDVSGGQIRTTTVSGGGGDVSSGQMRTTTVTEVKKTSSVQRSSAPSSSHTAGAGAGAVFAGGEGQRGDDTSKTFSTETTVISSDVARQRKRDSMLFGDADEPPLIVAGGEYYHPAQSDTALSTSSTSVGSGVSGGGSCQLLMPGRTVSEPAFSQTSSSSRESFVCRSDEALVRGSARPRHSDEETRQTMVTGRGLESSDGDGSVDTLGSVVMKGAAVHPDAASHSTVTTSRSSGRSGSGRQVYITETTVERRSHAGPDVSATTSEGSLRSIMKASSSSDKDSTSPSAMRRKITFMDNAEHKRFVYRVFLLPSYEAVVSCHSLLTVLINVRCHLMFLTEITKMLITDSCQHCVAELSSKHDCD